MNRYGLLNYYFKPIIDLDLKLQSIIYDIISNSLKFQSLFRNKLIYQTLPTPYGMN